MPEYLALTHYHSQDQDDPQAAPEWTPDELSEAFARMEQRGVARVVH